MFHRKESTPPTNRDLAHYLLTGMRNDKVSAFAAMVYVCKRSAKFIAMIRHLKKAINLGAFSSPQMAARAYDDAAKKLHGDFATLNFS